MSRKYNADANTPQGEIMRAYGFTSEEIEANKQGYLAKSQRRRLYNRRWEQLTVYGVPGLLCALLYTGIVLDGMARGNMSIVGAIVGAAVIGVIMAVLLRRVATRRQAIKADLYKGDLESVMGEVTVYPFTVAQTIHKQPKSPAHAYIEIGGKQFPISGKAEAAFVNGDKYRVYYVPQSMVIVSVQWLGK
jgi:hypothetical protein